LLACCLPFRFFLHASSFDFSPDNDRKETDLDVWEVIVGDTTGDLTGGGGVGGGGSDSNPRTSRRWSSAPVDVFLGASAGERVQMRPPR
jgi:hypothetical protein